MTKQKLNLSYLQGFLHAMSSINDGYEHGCEYVVYTIPITGDAAQSFNSHFGEGFNHRAQESLGAYQLEELHQSEQDLYHRLKHVEVTEIQDGQKYLETLLSKWFIHQDYSPTGKEPGTENNLLGLARDFIGCIKRYSDFSSLYHVEFSHSSLAVHDCVLLQLETEYLVINLGWY